MLKNLHKLLLSLSAPFLLGCDSFLDEKPDQKLVIPSTLTDLQALLNETDLMNHQVPNAGEISADNYYLTDADWAALPREQDRHLYVWAGENVFPPQVNDWNYNFMPVYVANTVLEQLASLPRTPANSLDWDDVKGQALYYRGHHFLQGALLWAPAYDARTASADLGIPLRLGTDFNVPSVRASVQQTYDRIVADLREAAALLPTKRLHPTRPYRVSAHALLARTFLAMGDYRQAALYADSCLQRQSALLDYNTLDLSAAYPVPQYNPEVITEHFAFGVNPALQESLARIDPALYASYAPEDLRRAVFFRPNGDGSFAFRGSYGGGAPFAGTATDELYLIRAEAHARLGNVPEAMQDLNTLLVTRWRAGTFVPLTAAGPEEALAHILRERRKELVLRNLRWMDLKRLNREGANITLSRTVQGRVYTLPPNDPRYALPLPDDVVALSGMPQNPR
ncbi:RagB/SusD family nutrient uptake outer membrane protein [Sabulibacter ruber]|uniref:RagB/SusD family nutrient uptake outer membrane protein n=1 Tax=Sabulibacter ruber TaxID=2811901 RepID=UPI001A971781|nr:RagB/SusD family nutrient uptake outer membrane protein [Sabulibacter ruber]